MREVSENRRRRYVSPADFIVAGLVLLFCVASVAMLFFGREEGELSASIYVRGELYETVELSSVKEPMEIEVSGKIPVLISVTSEGAEFKSSGCPDKLCMKRGVLSKDGESAVCLPAGVSLRIESTSSEPEVDAIVG